MLSVGLQHKFDSDLVFGLVEAMCDVALLLDPQFTIIGAHSSGGRRTLAELVGRVGEPIAALLDTGSASKLEARLTALRERAGAGDPGIHAWCEVSHVLGTGAPIPVRYSLHWLGETIGFLLLGRDQRPILEVQQQLVAAQMALERDYETRRELDTRYRILMEITRDPVVFVSTQTRRVVDLNAPAADLLGATRAELIGVDIGLEVESDDPAGFLDAAIAAAEAETVRPIEMQARRSQKSLMLTPRLFRAAGERLLVCRLGDAGAAPAAEADVLGDNLRALYAKGIDGIVFVDAEGTILSASESFLNLTDSATLGSVKGRSLADFLVRGSIDLKVLLSNAQRAGHLRLYPTRLKTDFDGEIAVEISATRLGEGPQANIALVVRDASRAEALRAPAGTPDVGGVSVLELVGSTALKDIVAATTNVVEKLCIETAVEMTRNNRVAAAEMLGLSRQSLYVKLRKYGLLGRRED